MEGEDGGSIKFVLLPVRRMKVFREIVGQRRIFEKRCQVVNVRNGGGGVVEEDGVD